MNKKDYSAMDILTSLSKTFISLLCEIRYKIITELNTLMLILQIALPIAFVELGFTASEMAMSMIVLMLVVRYVRDFTNELNGVSDIGIPIPRQKFTYIDEKGFIGYKKGVNQIDVMIYVNQVEEYLYKKGWL